MSRAESPWFSPMWHPPRRLAGRWEPFAWVDLALLAFFVFFVHSSFVVQPGIRIQLPASPFTGGWPYRSAVVTLTREGMVFFDDRRTTLEGLRHAFAQIRHTHHDLSLIIEADEAVPYGRLVEVYQMAMEVGIPEVLLATRVATEH